MPNKAYCDMIMKLCKNCGKEFPSNSQLKSRSYCLECSPPGTKAGYDLRKEKTISTNNKSKQCLICDRVFKYNKNKNNVCTTCRSRYKRHLNRQKALELCGTSCVKCGINDPDVLIFHHIDQSTKSFELSRAWEKNWDELVIELAKCELLCHNCHYKHRINEKIHKTKTIIEWYESQSGN